MTIAKPLKIVLLGDPSTGKSNLSSRLTSNHFNPKYEPTNGINADSHTLLVDDQRVEIDIFDLVGHEKWRCLADGLLRDADGILLVYDISNPTTFKNLAAWLKRIREAAFPKTLIKLVGNKNDLQDRLVSRKEAKQFATDNGLTYIETSALNDSNVHLAFETIAQEIDVAMHSVSEPPISSTDYFVQKDPKATSGHDDGQQDEPFQVVLIDIEQAALHKYIACVKKPLDEASLEFIAISYRWGEVEEQVIDTKLGYMASITSFALKDFYDLCHDIMKETDLQSIKYMWVDAICVDQNNHDRRKATIYQMSNIYHRAAYILAVPDLHLGYLRSNGLFDLKSGKDKWNFNEYIYYLLHDRHEQIAQYTEALYDRLGIPKDEIERQYLTTPYQKYFKEYLGVFLLNDNSRACSLDNCQYKYYGLGCAQCHVDPNITIIENIQHSISMCDHHTRGYSWGHPRKTLDMTETFPDSDEKWLGCLLREFCCDNKRRKVNVKSEAVAKLMGYLENLIMDWSSRVWVISEYNIAKAKQSRKMKFWFLSLRRNYNPSIILDRNYDEKLNFFVFDFEEPFKANIFTDDRSEQLKLDTITYKANESYDSFKRTLGSQLSQQSFLKMMLDSKASRNEDRFYAIFPSTKYKNKLTSREVVSSWQIDNIVSVKLKLYELMTIKDKLELLYLTANGASKPACTFPAFANINASTWYLRPIEERDKKSNPCNFDLNNNASLRLLPPDALLDNENGIHFHKLNLSPKMYYAIHYDETDYVKRNYNELFNKNKKLLEALDINYVDDELVFVYIPLYMCNIDRQELDYPRDYISLFGSFKKGRWLLCYNGFRYSYIVEPFSYSSDSDEEYINDFTWTCYDNGDGNTSFDIY